MPTSTLAASPLTRHVGLPDKADKLAKATVRIPDIDWLARLAKVIACAVGSAGWSVKEAAAHIGVDPTEFGRWLSGERRPQWDKLFAVSELREPLLFGLARAIGLPVSTRIDSLEGR